MKNLLGTRDMTFDQALWLLDSAEDMAAVQDREVKKLPSLRGKTVVNLFYEDSTRTRVSFETAAKRLSADVINFSVKGSSVVKGESLKDTAQTLAAIAADGVVLRHSSSGAPRLLADAGWVGSAIVNAGDGTHEHPTQALLDAFTIRRRLHGLAARGRNLDGVKVLIVGDILHSRVAKSNIWLLRTLGAELGLLGPSTLLPTLVDNWPVVVYTDFDQALNQKPDVVMMLRVQAERMNGAYFPSIREYRKFWGLSDERFNQLKPGTIVMHPGPMNRGLEISSCAADSLQSAVREQVANGVSVRMAVLYILLTGGNRG